MERNELIEFIDSFTSQVVVKLQDATDGPFIAEVLMDARPLKMSSDKLFEIVEKSPKEEIKALATLCSHTSNEEIQEAYATALMKKYAPEFF